MPDASSNDMEYILWNRTPFPFKIDAKTLYKAAARTARARRNNIILCDHCDNKIEQGNFECTKCRFALDAARNK